MASPFDLTTIDEVKSALRISDVGGDSPDDELIWLEMLITSCSIAIINYLKSGAEIFLDTALLYPVPEDVPENVKLATIMLIGYVYREPDGDAARAFSHGTLPYPVTAMIYQLRDPALG